MFFPFGNCFSLILIGNKMISSSVVRLFFSRSPSNVARFVVAVIVNAVDGISLPRTWTNVLKKRDKRITPTITNNNSTPAIIMKLPMLGVRYSVFNISPYLIFWHSFITLSRSVRKSYLASPTATTFGLVIKQILRWDFLDSSALALAKIPCFIALFGRLLGLRNNRPAINLLTGGKIDGLCQNAPPHGVLSRYAASLRGTDGSGTIANRSLAALIPYRNKMAMSICFLFLLPICGCEVLVKRPPIETRRLLAEAVLMEAQADVQKSWALCMESRINPKLAQNLKQPIVEVCGPAPSPVVTVTTSHKIGEVPSTQFSLVPSFDLSTLMTGGIVGGLPK